MGWKFVYNKLKAVLDDEKFQKENALWNPNTPTGAINVALTKLIEEYPYDLQR